MGGRESAVIVTFYSYKGGVGRSMAMANIADILARRGLKVLIVDFDLEAPGLEQFFQINVEGVRRHPGLLDLLLEYKQSMSVSRDDTGFRKLDRYICPVYERLPGGGRLDILPAGQRQDLGQLERYALNLRTFDWQDFYYNWEGELFFEWLRRSLTPRPYDVVLVDSRTGVTEMGGICGYQLADAIFMMCAANHQNMLGTANMVRDFRSSNVDSLRRGRKLDIVVVPARVEDRLKGKDAEMLDTFFRRFDEAFAALVPEPLKRAGLSLRELMIPYDPEYAFEEQVVSDPARHAQRRSIGATFDKLAYALALLAGQDSRLAQVGRHGFSAAAVETVGALPVEIDSAKASAAEAIEVPAPAQYDAAKRFAGYDFFLDYSNSDKDSASALLNALQARNFRVFFDEHDVSPGADWQAVTEEALFHSHAVLVCVGPAPLSDFRRNLLERAMQLRSSGQIRSVITVLFPGANRNALPVALSELQWIDLSEGIDERALETMHGVVAGSTGPQLQLETQARTPYPGANPFDEQQADLFCGREALVHELGEHLSASHLVVVTGGSGCGKTSLVRAGLIPRLRESERKSGQRWDICAIQPGPEAVAGVQRAISGLGSDARSADESAVSTGKSGASRLLIFIDQFEEFLTQYADSTVRTEFLSFLESVETHYPQVCLLIGVRADFIGMLSEFPVFARWLTRDSKVVMPMMSQEEMRRSIAGPAERVGIAFEPGLVERIVEDMAGGPGALGLLQGVLLRLSERRRAGWMTNAAYEEMGGLRGSVAQRADAVYRALPPEQQTAVRSIMLRLTLLGSGNEIARRRVRFDALFPTVAAENAEGRRIYVTAINALVAAGLLILDDENGQRVAEAAHELIIRGWASVTQWVEEERSFLEWRERLGATMALWRDAERNNDLLLRGVALAEAESQLDQRGSELSAAEEQFIRDSLTARDVEARASERRRRWVLRGAIALSAVFAVMAFVADMQRREAEAQELKAEQALSAAKEQFDIAAKQRDDANKALTDLQRNVETLRQVAAEASKARDDQAAKLAASEAETRKAKASAEAGKTREYQAARLAENEMAAARQAKAEAEARQARVERAARAAEATLTDLKTKVEASSRESNEKFEVLQQRSKK